LITLQKRAILYLSRRMRYPTLFGSYYFCLLIDSITGVLINFVVELLGVKIGVIGCEGCRDIETSVVYEDLFVIFSDKSNTFVITTENLVEWSLYSLSEISAGNLTERLLISISEDFELLLLEMSRIFAFSI
jgi:hypothetical protein